MNFYLKKEITSKEFNKILNFNLNKENFKVNELSKITIMMVCFVYANLNKIQKYIFLKLKTFIY